MSFLRYSIINDNIKCVKVALSETYQIFNATNVSYTNKAYKNQNTENSKIFGIF